MAPRRHSLDDDTRDILARSQIEGDKVFLPGQLDRPTYERVNKALSALGGKWNRKAGAHVFPFPASELMGEMLEAGELVDRRQALGFFETPRELAARMAREVDLTDDDLLLEPSAGHGALLRAAFDRAHTLAGAIAVEKDPHNARVLREGMGGRVRVHEEDFLALAARTAALAPPFTVALMNPPFADGQDMAHIRAAWGLLRPGGRMAAICSEGPFFRDDRKAAEFRRWLYGDVGADFERLPEGTFKASGTGVNARLILATKPEATPPAAAR